MTNDIDGATVSENSLAAGARNFAGLDSGELQ